MSHDDEDLRADRSTPAEGEASLQEPWKDADSEYTPDPDAAPTAEGRVAQAEAELRKLLQASLVATVGIGALIAAIDAARGGGAFPNTAGYLIGALLASLNLWILGGGFFAVMRSDGGSMRALLSFGGSFLALVLCAFVVVLARREWTLGFALGLATPAVAGILYGRSLDEDARTKGAAGGGEEPPQQDT